MKFQAEAKTPEAASTFAVQMADKALSTTDPVAAMTMRVASEMMAVLPKHAATASAIHTLMHALPNICISIVETVAATAYQGDMDKTRQATLVLLQRALATYENNRDVERVHVQKS